jgi:parallel beta-helix repeat protein
MRIINVAVAMLVCATVACDAGSANDGLVGPGGEKSVATVAVSPASASLIAGDSTRLTADAKDEQGNSVQTGDVNWTSSDTTVAVVSSTGVVKARKPGNAMIKARAGGVDGSADVDVTDPPVASVSVLITPQAATINALGYVAQLTATAKDSSGNDVPGATFVWTSLNPTVATVGATGTVTAKTVGTSLIVAAAGAAADTATLTVRQIPAAMAVNPGNLTLSVGGTGQLQATVADSGGTAIPNSPVTWGSSAPGVASVSSSGLVTGVSVGVATVATTSGDLSAAATVTVVAQAAVAGLYVSPTGTAQGDGTAERPWDLATALAGAAGRVQPGDTVWIRGGIYPNGGDLTVGGNATGYITFSGYPGEAAIIKKQFRGTASYVVIRQLVFEGPIDGATNQVYLHDNHHVVFTRNEIRNGDFHAGLSVDESHHYEITYNYIHDNGRDVSHDHGIYFKTTNGDGTVIANNLLVRNAARGLSLHDNSGAGVYDVVVAHNTIVANGSTGILVNDGDRNTLVNNIAVGNGDQTGQDQIRVLAGNSNKVWNNLTWHPTNSSRRGIENTTSSEMSGNLVADPLFVSYLGDLRLLAGSPAIDMGLAGWTFGGKDYAGKTRDSKPDVGAHEH